MPTPPAIGFSVLLVEDEFLIAMDLKRLLEGAGYRVVGPAATVTSALLMLDMHYPHACVLDVNLRGEHSHAVATRLKAQNIPFILSSAYGSGDLTHAAFQGVGNLGKPVPTDQLLAFLQAHHQDSEL